MPSDRTAEPHRQDLVAVVTGASRGIGAGLAAVWGGHGVRLGLCARTEPVAPSGSEAVTASVDVADPSALDRFADRVTDRFGRIDVWVNNAAVLDPIGPLATADPEAVRRNVETNLLGVAYGSATFARHVRTRPGGGSLVNLSSGAASSPYRGWAAYCATKAAVEMLTEVVGLEEQDSGMTAYAVSPGVVDTDMQGLIRSTPAADFADVPKFVQLHDDGVLASTRWVAEALFTGCVDPETRLAPEAGRGSVRFRVPDEPVSGRARR